MLDDGTTMLDDGTMTRPPATSTAAANSTAGAGSTAAPASVVAAAAVLMTFAQPAAASSQQTSDPFPEPIEAEEGVVVVDAVEFAWLPDVDGEPARPMKMVHEPASGRYFVADQWGTLYVVDEDGGAASRYLDVADEWADIQVDAAGRERGVQSFALHPGFADPASPGYGKLYVWTDTRDTSPRPDYRAGGDEVSHHTVLLEWTARDPAAPTYDGDTPRELLRVEQPFRNHNGGEIAFDPTAAPGDAGHGLLYVGLADGGSGGDPLDLAGDPGSPFGKILRIDPLGSDGPNGAYGIPADNPFAGDGDDGTLGEIWALGVRNPQHLVWDPATGALFVADIGQNAVEEVSVVTRGADLGWNEWEGSFRFVDRSGVLADGARADPDVTYPIVEYDHTDPLLSGRVAVTGLVVYRGDAIPGLRGRLLFGDLPNGEIFHVDADDLPGGGQAAIRRVLFRDGGSAAARGGDGAAGRGGDGARDGEVRTLLELVNDKRWDQEREPTARVDLRLGEGPGGRIFVMNKHDGTIRRLVAGGP